MEREVHYGSWLNGQASSMPISDIISPAMNFPPSSYANYLLSPLESLASDTSSQLGFDPPIPTFGFFSEAFPSLQHRDFTNTSDDQKLKKMIDFHADLKLQMPKYEAPDQIGEVIGESFVYKSEPFYSSFDHLPDLRSLEQVSADQFPADLFSTRKGKRLRTKSLSESYNLDVMLRDFTVPPKLIDPLRVNPEPVQAINARKRRQRLSDKVRILQKLLPWDKKMDQATMFDELYKYIKFLEAQITVLQSMPCESNFIYSKNEVEAEEGLAFGGLEKLNRQQLLQVVVNSPVAQTMLYSKEWCVFSIEQLAILRSIAAKRILLHHQLLDLNTLNQS